MSAWIPAAADNLGTVDLIGTVYSGDRLVHDSAAFTALWRGLYVNTDPKLPQPVIDFSTYGVLLVASTGGPPGTDIRMDSIVTRELGARAYITKCFGTGQEAAVAAPGVVYRIPIVASLGTNTRTSGLCPLPPL